MADVQADGARGSVRCGYQTAATLGAWQLTRSSVMPPRYVLAAAVVAAYPHWLAQERLTLRLVIGDRAWTWRDVVVEVARWELSATLDGVPTIEPAGDPDA